MKLLIKRLRYFIAAAPVLILLMGNALQNTLILKHTTGFLEDYPALWLTGVGIIINANIYQGFDRITTLSQLKVKNIWLRRLSQLIILLLSIVINHQWVISQLANNDRTWMTFDGKYAYMFAKTSEQFNVVGYFYYLVCIAFWALMLTLVYRLILSLGLLITKKIKKQDLSLDRKQFITYSGAIVASFLIYYVSLQINDIVIEGIYTFHNHTNRLVMMAIAVILLVVYVVSVSIIRIHNKELNIKVSVDIVSDIVVVTLPFLVITVLSIYLRQVLDHNLYLVYSIFTFGLLVVIICFTALYQYLKSKRIERLDKVMEENTIIHHYAGSVEALYKEMRLFKHDHKNIMLSIRYYIDNDDLEGLRDYYNNELIVSLPSGPQYELVNQLTLLKEPTLKGLLITKINHAKEKGIQVKLEIDTFENKIKAIDLTRILGILLDNAIEAAYDTDEPFISIILTKDEIIISNTYGDQTIDIESLFELGYSKKGSSRGIGLYSLNQTLKKYPYKLKTSVNEDYFIQRIITI